MAMPEHMAQAPAPATSRIGTGPAPARPSLAAEMARLTSLHAEAEETARLANLLGRTSHVIAALALATGIASILVFPFAAPGPLAAWLALMAVGLGGTMRAYYQAMRAPFERAPLAGFAEDLGTLLAYAGFAWGAGAFLALPAGTGLAAAMAFAILPAAILAGLLRAAGPSLNFLAPAAGLSAFAMVLRPIPGGVLGAALTVLAIGAIAAAAIWLERQDERHATSLAELPFA